MSARILIISNGALCRNPRVVKEASALTAAGYAVVVLTVRNHAPSEVADLEIIATSGFQRLVIEMLRGSKNPVRVWCRRLRQRLARELATRFGFSSVHALGPASALLAQARRLPADLTIVHNEVPHWVGIQLLKDGRKVSADFEDWHSEDLLPEDRRGRPIENCARLSTRCSTNAPTFRRRLRL